MTPSDPIEELDKQEQRRAKHREYMRTYRKTPQYQAYHKNYKGGLHYNSPVYRCWMAIKQRCTNPNDSHYKYYGARGIRMCDEWEASFEAFHNAIGERPSSRHSIDRIDNDKGYEPGNVRWTTSTVQNLNKRDRYNKTGYRGVSKGTMRGEYYTAAITIDYQVIYLGLEKDVENAAMLRMAAEEQLR